MDITPDAAKIKRWREERYWSQEHLAELAGIGLRTLQRIENGETASRESLKALAAAFDVDVIALSVDAKTEAAKIVRSEREKITSGLRLSFWVHLASYAFCMIVFAVINVTEGYWVMKWATLWWGVGLAGHGLTVVLVELAARYQRQAEEA